MKKLASLSLSLCLLLAVSANGQRTRKRGARQGKASKPTMPAPSPAAIPSPTPMLAPAEPVLLAVVNGQNITTADLDPGVRQEVESLSGKIAEARRQILELQINTLLLEAEAAKRRMSSQQLYDVAVKRKLTPATPTEIKKFIDDNGSSFDQSDPEAMRKDVAAYILAEKEVRLSGEFVNQLRATSPVVISADINNATLPPGTLIATVAGKRITAEMIDERVRPIAHKLRLNTYLLERRALDQTIYNLLLLAEANRRHVPPEELVRSEITDKVKPPTDAEVSKFYEENKARIPGELASVRTQIASYLHEKQQQTLENALADRLRKQANIRLLISEPPPLVQRISVDDDPARGDANAPVTIVEFTDFQCPSCAAMHPILDEVIKSYGNKVRFVVRDFPLSIHANARKAAEAANAAHAQGKFFEYAAILFKHQDALDVASLKKYAGELGLNKALFDAAVDSGKYAAEVRHDLDDGEKYGVDGTPTIFVNGVALTDLSAEGLRAAIEKALGSPAPKASAP